MIDIDTILTMLPHRYPFAMVDRVTALDIEAKTITAIKNVTINEPYFQGHFPGIPVMPGVLQVEAMAQVGGILMVQLLEGKTLTPYLTSIEKAKFRRVVKPGDQLHIEATVTVMRARMAKMEAKVCVGDAIASEASLSCAISET